MPIEDLAAQQRRETAERAKRHAKRQDDAVFLRTSGSALIAGDTVQVSSGSNGPFVPGQAAAFLGPGVVDVPSRTSLISIGNQLTTTKGDVKVFVRWTDGGSTKIFLGGDRPAIQIFEFNSTDNVASGVFAEATGPELTDWLLTARIYNLSSKQYTLHTIYGDGRSYIVTDQRIQYMIYNGNGFWSSGIIGLNGKIAYNASGFSNTSPAAGTLRYGYWSGAVGGIFSFAEWYIPIPYLDGPASGFTSRSGSGPAVLSGASPALTSLFDFALSGEKIFSSFEEKKWIKVPGALEDISGVGGQSCDGNGPSTTVSPGAYTLKDQSSNKQTLGYKIYTAYTFLGQVSTTDGAYSSSEDLATNNLDTYSFGSDFTVSAVCTFFTSGGRYALQSSGGGGGGFTHDSKTSYSFNSQSSIAKYIAPGVRKDEFSQISITGFSQPVTTSSNEFYNSIRVFEGGVYFSKTKASTEYRILLGGGEQVISPINGGDLLKVAFIPVAGQLELTNVSTSLGGNIYTEKKTKTPVLYYKNFVAQPDLEGTIQQIKIPEDTETAFKNVISAWYWPKSVSP
jgi:hypothetical protein